MRLYRLHALVNHRMDPEDPRVQGVHHVISERLRA